MKPKPIRIALATVAFLGFGVNVSAQTYTAIMSGENSQAFSFINNSTSRTTVTSIQSPFAYPNTKTGSADTQTYPTGWKFFRYSALVVLLLGFARGIYRI